MNTILLLGLAFFGVTIGSPDGSFYAVVEYFPGTELMTKQFTLYTKMGDQVYRVDDHPAHTYSISGSGGVFAMNERDLWFFDRQGKELWHQALDGVNGSGFSSEGAIFYVSEKSGIHIFDRDGMQVYDLPPGRLFASAEQGTRIATVSADTAYFFEHGVLQTMVVLSSPYAWAIDVTPDGAGIRVTYRDRVEVFDLSTGTKREP